MSHHRSIPQRAPMFIAKITSHEKIEFLETWRRSSILFDISTKVLSSHQSNFIHFSSHEMCCHFTPHLFLLMYQNMRRKVICTQWLTFHSTDSSPLLSTFLNSPLIRISRVSLTSSLRLQFTSSFMHIWRHKKDSLYFPLLHSCLIHIPCRRLSVLLRCGSGSCRFNGSLKRTDGTRDAISIAINQPMMHAHTLPTDQVLNFSTVLRYFLHTILLLPTTYQPRKKVLYGSARLGTVRLSMWKVTSEVWL